MEQPNSGKGLLVLDLNGTVLEIRSKPIAGRQPDFRLHSKAVYVRPRWREFLGFCHDHHESFDVAVWTSRLRSNAMPLVERLWEGALSPGPAFVLSQTDCQCTGPLKSPLLKTKKPLSRILQLYPGRYDPRRIRIMEDSGEKVLEEDTARLLKIASFNAEDREDCQLLAMLPEVFKSCGSL